MPRVLSYTPSWLSRPSPGFDVFSTKNEAAAIETRSSNELTGALKTIARRGTEVFVASGKEIRWTDLVMLKDDAEGKKLKYPDLYSIPSEEEQDSYVVR